MIANKMVVLLVVVAFAQVQADPITDYFQKQRSELSSVFADFCKAASDKVITDVNALNEDDDSNLFGNMLIQEYWNEEEDIAKLDKYQTPESQRDAAMHSCDRIDSYYHDVSQMFEKAKESAVTVTVPKNFVKLGDFDCVIVERLRKAHDCCGTLTSWWSKLLWNVYTKIQ